MRVPRVVPEHITEARPPLLLLCSLKTLKLIIRYFIYTYKIYDEGEDDHEFSDYSDLH